MNHAHRLSAICLAFASAGLVFSSHAALASQDAPTCGCESEFDYVVSYCERNLPAFHDNVTDETRSDYTDLKNTLRSEAAKAGDKVSCFKILNYYVEFFRDNHSRLAMGLPNVDESDAEAVAKFLASSLFKNRERLPLPPTRPKRSTLDDLLGSYETSDGAYKIQIIESKTPLRDYAGVVLSSKTPLWVPGQVKLELKRKTDGTLEAFSYMRNHSLRYSPDFPLEAGMLGKTWFKTSLENRIHHGAGQGGEPEIRVINERTAYLRIPTFSAGSSAAIEKLYKEAAKTIRSHPNLIIDVRDNGGGSDNNVSPLLDYLYTGPIQGDKVDLYVTADNIKMWESWYEGAKKDKKNYSRSDRRWFKNEIRKMKAAELGTFTSRSLGGVHEQEVFEGMPEHVAVIYNRNCASSCETLLFWAQQSDKTQLVGENSGGYVGYGEVGGSQTPCFDYTLHTSMTRYQEQRKYEVAGIPPDHRLDPTRDWVEQALALLPQP